MADMQELYQALQNADAAGDKDAATKLALHIQSLQTPEPVANPVAAKPQNIGRANPQKALLQGQDALFSEDTRNGLATAPINAYLGAKQFGGGLDSVEQNILAQNKAAEKKAPVSSLLSNVGMLAPSFMIPGSSTVPVAGAISAVQGALQPIEGEQTTENILKGKAINAAIGGAAGAAGQYGANAIGTALTNRAATKSAEAVAAQERNAMRDATLAEGRAAGLNVPNSEIAPTFLGNRLESIGGKAAIKQDLTHSNQEAVNALARKALNLPDNQAISSGTLDAIRKNAGKTYQEVANLSPQAAQDLEALKVARNEAQGWFNAYNRSARPDDLAKAKEARALADKLEGWIDWHAVEGGKQDLLPQLAEARKQIAKTYTVDRALNKATGEISAPVLGRMYDKGKPLSDGLDTIGKFQQAFPKFMGEGASTPVGGIGKAEALGGAMMGLGTAAATGSPTGLLAAGIPLLSHPARALALSKLLQTTPEYGVGAGTKALANIDPQTLGVLARALAGYAPALAAK